MAKTIGGVRLNRSNVSAANRAAINATTQAMIRERSRGYRLAEKTLKNRTTDYLKETQAQISTILRKAGVKDTLLGYIDKQVRDVVTIHTHLLRRGWRDEIASKGIERDLKDMRTSSEVKSTLNLYGQREWIAAELKSRAVVH